MWKQKFFSSTNVIYLGLAAVCMALALCSSQPADAADFEKPKPFEGTWYNFPLMSKHVNTDTAHNERNWGFGVERYMWGRNWQIGAYRNSFWKPTTYVMTELTYLPVHDNIRLRFNAGLVTGYKYTVTPMILPVWTYDSGKRWGFDVLTIPSVAGRQGIYALQAKIKF
jgi:hypothetical protein